MSELLPEQFPVPSANANWIGQHDAEQTLLQAAVSGRLPHAWLFTGPEGIGKATLAYHFARMLLSGRKTICQGTTKSRASVSILKPAVSALTTMF